MMKALVCMSMLLICTLGIGCGDDDDGGNDCERAARLLADAQQEACSDYADCSVCNGEAETTTETAACEGDALTAAQACLDDPDTCTSGVTAGIELACSLDS